MAVAKTGKARKRIHHGRRFCVERYVTMERMAIRRYYLDINRNLLRKVMRSNPGRTKNETVRDALRMYIRANDPEWAAKRDRAIQEFRADVEKAAVKRAAKISRVKSARSTPSAKNA